MKKMIIILMVFLLMGCQDTENEARDLKGHWAMTGYVLEATFKDDEMDILRQEIIVRDSDALFISKDGNRKKEKVMDKSSVEKVFAFTEDEFIKSNNDGSDIRYDITYDKNYILTRINDQSDSFVIDPLEKSGCAYEVAYDGDTAILSADYLEDQLNQIYLDNTFKSIRVKYKLKKVQPTGNP